MLNQFVLVGRIVDLPKYEDLKNENNQITISVKKVEKNNNGEHLNDIVTCVLQSTMAKNISDYCLIGDLVGLKGRIQTRRDEKQNNIIELLIEKASFLSNKAND